MKIDRREWAATEEETGVVAQPPPKSMKVDKRPANVESGMGVQIFAIIGVGVLLVVVLFITTIVSKRMPPTVSSTASTSSSVTTEEIPLSGDLAERINDLDTAIASDTSALSFLLQREKVYVLVQGGRLDLAADLQSQIAEETGLAEDWKTAGDLYYEQMTDETQPELRSRSANFAVSAYQEALLLNPENLDVRTDMATAYLNTGSPMLGVTEIKKVLEMDPDHLNANFNYGLMLARISRNEDAIDQLERVLRLAPDSTSMHYQRAVALISSIREQTNL
ncbi:MAG: tetratricopeptide repeat protein [Bacteroidetes bacterium]|nr:tetratricopeptide repeat protein [Bacteroidota bacterium]